MYQLAALWVVACCYEISLGDNSCHLPSILSLSQVSEVSSFHKPTSHNSRRIHSLTVDQIWGAYLVALMWALSIQFALESQRIAGNRRESWWCRSILWCDKRHQTDSMTCKVAAISKTVGLNYVSNEMSGFSSRRGESGFIRGWQGMFNKTQTSLIVQTGLMESCTPGGLLKPLQYPSIIPTWRANLGMIQTAEFGIRL